MSEIDNSESKALSDSLRGEATKLGIDPITKPNKEDEEEVEELETEEKEESKESKETKDDKESDDESEEEEESESEDEEEDEEESEESEEEEADDPKPRKYIPIKKYKGEKAEWRTEKQKYLDTINKLTEDNEKLVKEIPQKPSEARTKLYERLKAADPKFDPSGLDSVIDTIKEEMGQSGKVPTELAEQVKALTEYFETEKGSRLKASDERFFSKSWSGFLPSFSKDFPTANEEQKEAAKGLMDKLWHTKQFHDKEIDYVYFKNRAEFDKIISPRKKGLETGQSRGYVAPKDGKAPKLSSAPSTSEIRAAEKALADASASEDDLQEMDSTL